MSVSEFVFLAMGLLLGGAAGAALVEVLRARPPAPREVKVTVAQDAIPRRRAATLADDAFSGPPPEPARGGPADRRIADDEPPSGMPDRRTPVQVGVAAGAATAKAGAGSAPVEPGGGAMIGVPVTGGDDPVIAAFRASAAASAVSAMAQAGMTGEADMTGEQAAGSATAVTAVATATGGRGPAGGSGATPAVAGGTDAGASEPGGPGAAATAPVPEGPCADLRLRADERCELAARARDGAVAAEDSLRAARRAYDDHEAQAETAARLADPRAVRDAKDAAQAAFRAGRNAAATTEEVEATARAWLLEINRINAEARDAAAVAAREREAVRELTLQLERLAIEADAARIASETAAAACVAAREAVADCEERRVADEADEAAEAAAAAAAPVAALGLPAEDEALAAALGGGGTPRIFRLLRGERAAMSELVTALAGDDGEARRHWQIALSDLVDAIIADSIAATALAFPSDHPFWGPFTIVQDREIAAALASLGYRFDGMGGWVDGRVPSQRDLSLAVGYAGLDPMRIRHWPTEAEMAELYRDVVVAADEHLAARAGDLTLGELVTMLGRRADGLAEVWNEWGRLRPLLLAEA